MSNRDRRKEELRGYFAAQPVPGEIHQRLLRTLDTLGPLPAGGGRPRGARPLWRRAALSLGAVAAAFLVLCGTNAVNPALAESIPLVGLAFRLYNQESKLAVGSYVGTYPEMERPDAQAEAQQAGGMELTAAEAYCDGKFIHLSFTLGDVPEAVAEGLYCLGGEVSARAAGEELEAAGLTLYPQGDGLAGTVALQAPAGLSGGQTLEVAYQVGELTGYYDQGGTSRPVEGAFTGRVSLTVDESHNQTYEDFQSAGEVEVHWVEATPSYTKVQYTVPNWGWSSYQVNNPALFLPDGTRVQSSLEGFDGLKAQAGADTVTTTAWFDGLPNGTETVILRFFEEQVPDWDPASGEPPMAVWADGELHEVRVLAEVTVDLATGEAQPSETYREAGLSFAEDYYEAFAALSWTLPFDDPQAVELGQAAWSQMTGVEGLFQNGETLWSLRYSKGENTLEVRMATDGPAPTREQTLTLRNEAGETVAQGTLSPTGAQQRHAADAYYEWGLTLEAQAPLRLMETVTLTLEDPATGETLYQRSLRLERRD